MKRVLGFLVVILLLAAGGAALYASSWWNQAKLPVGGDQPVRVTVAKGATLTEVAADLEKRKIIRSATAFGYLARGKAAIQPGVYDLKPSETPQQILEHLVKGDIVRVKVTFPEGWTLRQMAARLEKNGLVKADSFLNLVTKQGNTLKASFSPPENLEGYLFPDTYQFPLGESEREIAQRMLGNFDAQMAKREEARKKSGRSLRDIVIIAAMIEREARVAQDRPRIAGVIYNRLAQRMPLQIDATVLYAHLQAGGQHKERLLFRDLEINSPYNTYKVVGLPAGPICNPGIASIDAALAPEKSDYLYYVAKPDGSHAFARTLAEHNRNIAAVRNGVAPPPLPPSIAPPGAAAATLAPQQQPRAPRRRRTFRRRSPQAPRRAAAPAPARAAAATAAPGNR